MFELKYIETCKIMNYLKSFVFFLHRDFLLKNFFTCGSLKMPCPRRQPLTTGGHRAPGMWLVSHVEVLTVAHCQ